jgi:hypothetical protein
VIVLAAGAALLAAWLAWGAGCCPAVSNWTPEPSPSYTPYVYPTRGPTFTASPIPPTRTPIPPCRPEVTCSPTSPWDKPPATTTPYPPTATPTPTMSAEEQAVVKEIQRASWSAPSAKEYWRTMEDKHDCYFPTYIKRITRPEWERLFPGAAFTLVKYDWYGTGDKELWPKRRNEIFAEQDYERIGLDGFERLLLYLNDFAKACREAKLLEWREKIRKITRYTYSFRPNARIFILFFPG